MFIKVLLNIKNLLIFFEKGRDARLDQVNRAFEPLGCSSQSLDPSSESGIPMEKWRCYPLVNIQKAIENGHLLVGLPIKHKVIFHSYVKVPEGNGNIMKHHFRIIKIH